MSCVVLYLGALLTLLHGGGAAHASATDQHDAAAAVDRRSLAAGAGFRFMRVHLDSNSLYRCVGTHTHTHTHHRASITQHTTTSQASSLFLLIFIHAREKKGRLRVKKKICTTHVVWPPWLRLAATRRSKSNHRRRNRWGISTPSSCLFHHTPRPHDERTTHHDHATNLFIPLSLNTLPLRFLLTSHFPIFFLFPPTTTATPRRAIKSATRSPWELRR